MRSPHSTVAVALLLAWLAAPAPARAQEVERPLGAVAATPAELPPWRAAITFGAGTDGGRTYLLLGGTVGYVPVNRMELFLDGLYWAGASPPLGRLAVGANWFPPLAFTPYLGGYLARWFVGNEEADYNAIGLHAGVALTRTSRAVVLAGVAWEHLPHCSNLCDSWWPELSAGFRF